MSVPMRKHPIESQLPSILRLMFHGHIYEIPRKIVEKYEVSGATSNESVLAEDVFHELDQQYTKAGALLKGLRYREGLSQIDFAKKIAVSQADLSKMENGKRPIGKIIAKRIAKVFEVNYKMFLE